MAPTRPTAATLLLLLLLPTTAPALLSWDSAEPSDATTLLQLINFDHSHRGNLSSSKRNGTVRSLPVQLTPGHTRPSSAPPLGNATGAAVPRAAVLLPEESQRPRQPLIVANHLHGAQNGTVATDSATNATVAPAEPSESSSARVASAHAGKQPRGRGVFTWMMFLVGLLTPPLLYLAFRIISFLTSRCVGRAIELAIEKYDTSALGVDVDIGKLLVNPFSGYVAIHGLTIDNPQGYKSDYLLSAKTLIIDFSIASLLFSNFRHVVVEKIVLRRVDIIYEKGWSSSNVHDILHFLEGKLEKWAKWLEERKQQQHVRKKTKEIARGAQGQELPPEEKTLVEVREVLVEDVGVRLQGQMLGGHGARLALADIRYDNLTRIAGATYVDDVLKVLLKSIMKTVVANVAGRQAADRCDRCI